MFSLLKSHKSFGSIFLIFLYVCHYQSTHVQGLKLPDDWAKIDYKINNMNIERVARQRGPSSPPPPETESSTGSTASPPTSPPPKTQSSTQNPSSTSPDKEPPTSQPQSSPTETSPAANLQISETLIPTSITSDLVKNKIIKTGGLLQQIHNKNKLQFFKTSKKPETIAPEPPSKVVVGGLLNKLAEKKRKYIKNHFQAKDAAVLYDGDEDDDDENDDAKNTDDTSGAEVEDEDNAEELRNIKNPIPKKTTSTTVTDTVAPVDPVLGYSETGLLPNVKNKEVIP